MTIITVLLAFLAGIVSFASPCCLPLVPAYVSYMVGTTPADSPNARRIAFHHALAYVLGFTIVFAPTRVLNFAQGEALILGAAVAFKCLAQWKWGIAPTLLVLLVAGILGGVLCHFVV